MKIKRILIPLTIILFVCSALWAQIDFFKEDLQFELNENFFKVAGNYYFRNVGDHDIKVTLFYPIPRDSMLGAYDSASVTAPSQQTASPITVIKENGFFFNVEVGVDTIACYHVAYRQKLLGERAKYIFTSTKSWGKPLEKVDFQLRFPKTIKIDSLSMLPDSLQECNDTYTLFWERKNFMPEEDFVVYYHKEKHEKISILSSGRLIDRNHFFYLRLTPFLIPGGAVGYTRRIHISDEVTFDFTLAANYHYLPEVHKSYGFSLTTEHFSNSQAKGFFFRSNVGAEYAEMQNPLDDDPDPEKKWIPNATIGLGYSFIILNSSYLRLSAEFGYTMLFGRINCEFLF